MLKQPQLQHLKPQQLLMQPLKPQPKPIPVPKLLQPQPIRLMLN